MLELKTRVALRWLCLLGLALLVARVSTILQWSLFVTIAVAFVVGFLGSQFNH